MNISVRLLEKFSSLMEERNKELREFSGDAHIVDL